MQIYISKNGEQSGPFTDEQLEERLNAGKISYDDMSWKEGMAEWQPLRQIVAPPVPPPVPAAAPAPITQPVDACQSTSTVSLRPPIWKRKFPIVIRSREDALDIISWGVICFTICSALFLLSAIAVNAVFFVGAISYGVGALLLHRFKSRCAAIFLCLLASLGLIIDLSAGATVWMDICIIILSVRVIYGTFKLHGNYAIQNA